MPELSRFFNIVVRMLYADNRQHNKPHVHVLFAEHEASVGIDGELLAGSLPSVILTWFKLRRRDLGAILNAGGWAANRPLRFSNGLAREFTRLAVLPPGAYAARDPYSRTPWKAIFAVILVALAILLGWAWKTERWPFCPKKACAPAAQTQPAPAAPSANAEVAK